MSFDSGNCGVRFWKQNKNKSEVSDWLRFWTKNVIWQKSGNSNED